MLFYVRYYPKQTRYFSFVMIIATTFTVCLVYRHYRNTRLVQFLVIAYMYVLRLLFFFCCCCFFFFFFLFFLSRVVFSYENDHPTFDDGIYLLIIFCILIQCFCVQVPYQKLFRKWAREMKRNNKFTTANK